MSIVDTKLSSQRSSKMGDPLMQKSLVDYLPLWGLFAGTVAIVLLSVEAGFQIGTYRRRQAEHEQVASVGSIVAGSLGLLAFMLAFTFGMSAERFDVRRGVIVEEANAIEKAYFYARLLPEPNRTEIRALLREYVDIAVETALHPENLKQGVARSEALQNSLCSQAVAVSEGASKPDMTALFVESLAQMIEVRTKRLNWLLRHRIPTSIWIALYLIAVLSMTVMGYQSGLSGARSLLPAFLLCLAFAAVILLITILDRPPTTVSDLSQQPMIDLRTKITAK
jgi:hypothetical protein